LPATATTTWASRSTALATMLLTVLSSARRTRRPASAVPPARSRVGGDRKVVTRRRALGGRRPRAGARQGDCDASREADSGAVTLIQRFGSAANLNIHLHCLMLDGVYRHTDGEPVFVEVAPPSDEALQAALQRIITRILKLLTRRGVLIEEQGQTYMADNDADSDDVRTLRPLQAAACTYRIAFGPRAGQKVLTVQNAMPRDAGFKQDLCADINGFSLHAAVRCGSDERQALEQLCRYINPPGAGQRAGAMQRRGPGGAEAEDTVAR
jgi:hypothetical protein